jgi:hypothetical protein
VSFGLTLSSNLSAAPTLSGLPAGATYSYNTSTGVVTLTGMPVTLASGARVGPITVNYTQPPAGTSTVTATISATTLDPNPANNTATATISGVAVADVASRDLPGERQRRTAGGRHGDVHQQWSQLRERRHLRSDAVGQSVAGAGIDRPARWRDVQLQLEHRCGDLDRHADDAGLGRKRRSRSR